MDELLSMIDELKSSGVMVDELQLEKSVEVYRYLQLVARQFGGIVEPPQYSMEGCGFEFKCDYFDMFPNDEVFKGLLRNCSELEINWIPNGLFSMSFLVPGVFRKELKNE